MIRKICLPDGRHIYLNITIYAKAILFLNVDRIRIILIALRIRNAEQTAVIAYFVRLLHGDIIVIG